MKEEHELWGEGQWEKDKPGREPADSDAGLHPRPPGS